MSSTIHQSHIQAIPSTTKETIKKTSVSSLISLTTTVPKLLTTTVQKLLTTTVQKLLRTAVPKLMTTTVQKLLRTTVWIRETAIVMPNIKEMDCKVSPIGIIGFVLGAVVVITICIIIVYVFFTLRRKKMKLHDYNNK